MSHVGRLLVIAVVLAGAIATSAAFARGLMGPPWRERPEIKTDFPPIRDWNSLRIGLLRGPGMDQRCPSYSLEISGDGRVDYRDRGFGGDDHNTMRRAISPQAVHELFEKFRGAKFFWLFDDYLTPEIRDERGVAIWISFDGYYKQVREYGGRYKGMPEAVSDLEDAIDRAADRMCLLPRSSPEKLPPRRPDAFLH